jgi:hypothetical protein
LIAEFRGVSGGHLFAQYSQMHLRQELCEKHNALLAVADLPMSQQTYDTVVMAIEKVRPRAPFIHPSLPAESGVVHSSWLAHYLLKSAEH